MEDFSIDPDQKTLTRCIALTKKGKGPRCKNEQYTLVNGKCGKHNKN